jgi:TRAP-type C4-dicarboxylate transport system substrate-binding protein
MQLRNFLAAAVAALALVPAGATAEDYPKMTFTYAHMVGPTHALAKFDNRWVELVEEGSGGQITFEVFWSGSMGGPTEIPDLVGSGAVDFGSTALGYLPSQFPLASVVGQMQRTFATPEDARSASMEIFSLAPVQEELKKNNIAVLNTTTANPYNLTCNKPIRTMEDFKGTRIRANGKYPPAFFDALGASPQTVAFAEMYEALEKGLIDCAWMSHDFAISSNLNEVAPYAIDLNLGAVPATQLLANRQKFESLPEAVQSLMKEAAEQSSQEEFVYLEEVFQTTIDDVMPEKKMEYVHFEEVDKFTAMEPDMPQVWADDAAEMGLAEPAGQVKAVLDEYRAKLVN